MLVDERRRRIASLVLDRGASTVSELSEAVGVSAVTIRSDLEALEKQGLLKRNHGGAVARRVSRYAPDFLEKSSLHHAEKAAIAAQALDRIEDGDHLILDAGSTTLALAHNIHNRELTVVINSVYLLNELFDAPRIELISVGGNLHPRNLCFVGPLAEAFLKEIHVDKVFLGVNGISERGISVTNSLEAGVKRFMIGAAKEVIVLADTSKVGQNSFINVAPLSHVHKLVTDASISAHHLSSLGKAGIEVLIAGSKHTTDRFSDKSPQKQS